MAKKKKKKKVKIKKLPLIFLLVLIIIIGLFMHFTSSKYLFTKAYNKSMNMKEESWKEFKSKYIPFIDSNYYLETNTIFDYNENKNKITGKIYLEDSDNYFDLNIVQNNVEKNLAIINKDDKVYYRLKDSFYYVENTNKVDSDVDLSKTVNNYFKKYIKKAKLSKSKETIEYDTKYKTKKLTMKLTNKEFYNFELEVLRDKNIKNQLTNSKDYIKKIEDQKNKEKTINNYFEYSIYTYKGTPILEEYKIKDSFEISIFNFNDYKHIKYKKKDSKKESYIIVKDNKIDLFIDEYFYGKGTIKDDSIEITFTDYDGVEIGNLLYSIENDNNIYNVIFKMTSNLESLKLNIDVNNKIDTNKSIPSIDLKNAKSISEASKEELETFMELVSF